jgi:hypothetical protein
MMMGVRVKESKTTKKTALLFKLFVLYRTSPPPMPLPALLLFKGIDNNENGGGSGRWSVGFSVHIVGIPASITQYTVLTE